MDRKRRLFVQKHNGLPFDIQSVKWDEIFPYVNHKQVKFTAAQKQKKYYMKRQHFLLLKYVQICVA